MDILKKRYAKGEISKEDFERMKARLRRLMHFKKIFCLTKLVLSRSASMKDTWEKAR
jgi:hypothetical protein